MKFKKGDEIKIVRSNGGCSGKKCKECVEKDTKIIVIGYDIGYVSINGIVSGREVMVDFFKGKKFIGRCILLESDLELNKIENWRERLK